VTACIHASLCNEFSKDRDRANQYTSLNWTAAPDGFRGNAFRHVLWVSMMTRSVYRSSAVPNEHEQAFLSIAKGHLDGARIRTEEGQSHGPNSSSWRSRVPHNQVVWIYLHRAGQACHRISGHQTGAST
jgi:hypothetical protein